MTQTQTSPTFLHTTIPSVILVYLDELVESALYFNPVLYQYKLSPSLQYRCTGNSGNMSHDIIWATPLTQKWYNKRFYLSCTYVFWLNPEYCTTTANSYSHNKSTFTEQQAASIGKSNLLMLFSVKRLSAQASCFDVTLC